MKVYAVVYGYAYEGYAPPEGLFSTHDAAVAYARAQDWRNMDDILVLEYELDDPNANKGRPPETLVKDSWGKP